MAFAKRKTESEAEPMTLDEQIETAKATLTRLQALETETAKAAAAAYQAGGAGPEPESKAVVRNMALRLLEGVDVLDLPPEARQDARARRTLGRDPRSRAARVATAR